VRKADNLPPSCAFVTKSGNLNFLEPSGPGQACNGTDLPLPLIHEQFFKRLSNPEKSTAAVRAISVNNLVRIERSLG